MRTQTGVATRMFGALAAQGINITMINTSEVRINVATDLERGRDGFRALEAAFELDA
jgi:aspartate kinase